MLMAMPTFNGKYSAKFYRMWEVLITGLPKDEVGVVLGLARQILFNLKGIIFRLELSDATDDF